MEWKDIIKSLLIYIGAGWRNRWHGVKQFLRQRRHQPKVGPNLASDTAAKIVIELLKVVSDEKAIIWIPF